MLDNDLSLEKYILDHIDTEGTLMEDLSRQTNLKTVHPQMSSGHLQGKILEMISKLVRPSRILEIGTFTGYSAISLARGLKENGKLVTIDIDDELKEMAARFFQLAGCTDKIIQITGDALEVMKEMDENFDLIFIDGEKSEYPAYYQLAVNLLNPRGLILADNVLWGGKVVENNSKNDIFTAGILEFNKIVRDDVRVEKVILPVRDGIFMIRKKAETV
ncbi:MAG: O-methyltransferase [Bacteroidales bacterium]|nr:O-methyltransferase [Bacteroidales bacterium]